MNLDGKITNPGELNIQIELQSSTITQVSGGQKPSYTTLAAVWAKWVNAHGVEATGSDSKQAIARATVTIRYLDGVDTTNAVLYQSARWQIVSVDNIRQRNEYLELKLEKMTGSL